MAECSREMNEWRFFLTTKTSTTKWNGRIVFYILPTYILDINIAEKYAAPFQ